MRQTYKPAFASAVGILHLALAVLLSATACSGQAAANTPPPEVVAKLRAAKRIFIGPILSHGYLMPPPTSRDRDSYLYQDADYFQRQIISTIELWRLYQLVPDSAGSDLILEPAILSNEMRITVRETSTQETLWVFREELKQAILPINVYKNLAHAVPALLDDFRRAIGPLPAPASVPIAKTVPRVFISNVDAGSDDREPYLLGSVTGGSGQAYNKFYAAVKSSPRLEAVMAPAEADFIFEMRYVDAARVVTTPQETLPEPHHRENKPDDVEHYYYPQVKLIVLDRKTQATVLSTTENVGFALFSAGYDKNFAKSIANVLNAAAAAIDPSSSEPAVDPAKLSLPHKMPQAPIPSQIGPAEKVFLAKPGQGVHANDATLLLYDAVQTSVKDWARYQIVSQAADADLILEPSVSQGIFSLNILDPETSIRLWAFHWGRGEDLMEPKNLKAGVKQATSALMKQLRGLDGIASAASPNATAANSASSTTPGAGPVPASVSAQLASAKKVYLSNEARNRQGYIEDDNSYLYGKVRSALKTWGKYELTRTAPEADLIIDPSIHDLNLELEVMNPKAGGKLWTFTQSVQKASFYLTWRKNISHASETVMQNLRLAEAEGSGVPQRP